MISRYFTHDHKQRQSTGPPTPHPKNEETSSIYFLVCLRINHFDPFLLLLDPSQTKISPLTASKTSFLLVLLVRTIFSPAAAASPPHPLRRTLQEEGQTCTIASVCPYGQFCKFEDELCGTQKLSTLSGVCTQLNFRCTKIFRPVCGCDKYTYANSCLALSHGVSVMAFESCVDEEEGET